MVIPVHHLLCRQRDFIQAVAGIAEKGWPGVTSGEVTFGQLFALVVPIQVLWGVQGVMPGGDVRVISDCHFSVQLNHFIPVFLSYSVAGFLK
jgi:hypothetical protein